MNKNSFDEVIIIFSRFPEAGKVKTRLIPSIGADAAAALQKSMTEFTLKQAELYTKNIMISYCGATCDKFKSWLGIDYIYSEQVGDDLGERMSNAFINAFKMGAKRIVLLGCDTPDNRVGNITDCFNSLKKYDSAFGPSIDGGYYMIGLSRFIPELFVGINWGNSCVLADTLAKVNSYKLFAKLQDVDYKDDIPEKISVIIPALNEEDNILRTISSVHSAFNAECIVVDGGSSDSTVEVVKSAGAKVEKSSKGRAVQMNFGAERSSGEILLFLHADSELLAGWDIFVRRVSSKYSNFIGCFGFRVRERIPYIWVIEKFVWVRSKIFKKPYGDQALFVKKDDFERIGEYPNVPIMEDLFLVKKFRKYGKVVQVRLDVLTSARRWKKLGVLKTTILNQVVLIAAWFGADLERLRSIYRTGESSIWSVFKNK